MRVFTSSCIDNKTKHEMVLSETSFNHAMSFLASNGITVQSCTPAGELILVKTTGRTFYYDENRGYLLGD